MAIHRNTAVEKMLLKLRNYLLMISTSKSGRISRSRTVDGRVLKVTITPGGQITISADIGGTEIEAWFNGVDRLRYSGSRADTFKSRVSMNDADTIEEMRKVIKRVYPDYNKVACTHRMIQPTRPKIRIIAGTVKCGTIQHYK